MLLQLYRDLVITQVISSEEFWSQHAAEYTQAKKIQRQEIGVNSAFLVRFFLSWVFLLNIQIIRVLNEVLIKFFRRILNHKLMAAMD